MHHFGVAKQLAHLSQLPGWEHMQRDDVVVHGRRRRDGVRFVDEIALLHRVGEQLQVCPVWSACDGTDARGAERCAQMLATRGVAIPDLLR